MLGTIIGDIAGSRFENHPIKTKKFDMFHKDCHITDDTTMTLAIAASLIRCGKNYDNLTAVAEEAMRKFGRIYPNAGYGQTFIKWIWSSNPQPYNSWGNGSAMRAGPCGIAAKNMTEVKSLAKKTSMPTHNHPEGIKGAQAVAAAVFMAKSGKSKEAIRKYIDKNYYPMDFTLDEIRPDYEFDVSCQGSVPQALMSFFESVNFEDAIRNAVSLGGDCDTTAAIAGSVAEPYYGIPKELRDKAFAYLNPLAKEVINEFEKIFIKK
ncbi:type I restriction enzyme M protein [Parelusimicrobium proximum]|uniref:ADP-ribosylglycohydrolase family protein n=1 Tax=Parelusimicrobium proximum TaxID=3228953 RepID=UPI003D17A7B7